MALLRKSADGGTSSYRGQTYATPFARGMPRAPKAFSTAIFVVPEMVAAPAPFDVGCSRPASFGGGVAIAGLSPKLGSCLRHLAAFATGREPMAHFTRPSSAFCMPVCSVC
jgi:hypothetical protein